MKLHITLTFLSLLYIFSSLFKYTKPDPNYHALFSPHLSVNLSTALNITQTKSRLQPPTVLRSNLLSLLYTCSLTSLSGDLHPNPGPRKPRYPCGICTKSVKVHDPAIQCDECDFWIHTGCFGMSDNTYRDLQHRSVLWFCPSCGLTSYISSFHSLDSIDLTNSFSQLDTLQAQPEDDFDTPVPLATSTPTKHPRSCKSNNRTKKVLQAIIINANSVKSNAKVAQLNTLISTHSPDAIFLVETKVDDTVPTYSFLPSNYQAIRKDRDSHGGGVLIAFRDDIISNPEEELNTSCEITWAKVHFAQSKAIYFASFYRPPGNSSVDLEQLHESLAVLYNRHNKSMPNVVIGGDFNLPDIDWESYKSTNTQTASRHDRFLEILSEFGLTNMVNEVTRPESENILDLVLTSNPSLIINTSVAPGMSDHDAVTFQLNLKPLRPRKPPHKVYSYKSANWEELHSELSSLSQAHFARNDISLNSN